MGEANVMFQHSIDEGNMGNDGIARNSVSGLLPNADLRRLLEDREHKMKTGPASEEGSQASGETDQWHVYKKITDAIQSGKPLRLMVQASAGTGKTFLLTTVALWCEVHTDDVHAEKLVAKACVGNCPARFISRELERRTPNGTGDDGK